MKKALMIFLCSSILTGCVSITPDIMETAGVTNGAAALEMGDIIYYGAEPNYEEAAGWYYRSAIMNNAEGRYKLAGMWEGGVGLEQNYAEAAYWYEKSAEQGYMLSQYKSAIMYHTGTGVEADPIKASRWLLKAAAKGHAGAQQLLADFYRDGYGVAQSEKNAAKWYRKSAELGNREAQMIMGNAYTSGGLGLDQDAIEGCAWFITADMSSSCSGLTTSETAKAEKKAASIVKKIAKNQK